MNLQERFDRWTTAINQNPDGFTKSQTGKRRFARGQPSICPYENMAIEVYGEDFKPERSARGIRRRALRAAIDWHKPQPIHHMHSAARRRLAADSSLPLAA